jgi:p-hydroxybenzoate 3-monooxygenase
MKETQESTTVVIIGAGVSGFALATFLQQSGIAFIVLERRGREYIELRQRAGVVDGRAVAMFERRGLADTLLAGPAAQTIDYRINGYSHTFDAAIESGGSAGRFCTQQMLVHNLMRELIDHRGGDVRFEACDLTIINDENEPPKVVYSDVDGSHVLACDYIVGCDGDRGVSRTSIPAGVLTTFTHEFGYAWIAALVEAPLTGHPLMGISDHGCVAQLPRGPQRSRYYLQCALGDTSQDWPDERLWNEIRLRVGDSSIQNARVLDRMVVPLRSVVHAPMQFRRLFLAGDAAHLVPPTSAKGMNLALYDVDVLADALAQAINGEDVAALERYSEVCLSHVWNYQDFAVWMTDMMHDAGDASLRGSFRQMIARARLDNLFHSPTAARLHIEYQTGTN